MANRPHPWDDLVKQMVGEMGVEADWLTNALLEGSNAPFEQPVSEEQKRAYYESQMYNDSGTPNESGRQQVLQRIGVQNYIPLLQELEKQRNGTVEAKPPMSIDTEYTQPEQEEY